VAAVCFLGRRKNVAAEDIFIFTRTEYFSFEPPKQEPTAYDEYVSDPAKPVPFVNYVAADSAAGIHGVGPAIRGVADGRADVPDGSAAGGM